METNNFENYREFIQTFKDTSQSNAYLSKTEDGSFCISPTKSDSFKTRQIVDLAHEAISSANNISPLDRPVSDLQNLHEALQSYSVRVLNKFESKWWVKVLRFFRISYRPQELKDMTTILGSVQKSLDNSQEQIRAVREKYAEQLSTEKQNTDRVKDLIQDASKSNDLSSLDQIEAEGKKTLDEAERFIAPLLDQEDFSLLFSTEIREGHALLLNAFMTNVCKQRDLLIQRAHTDSVHKITTLIETVSTAEDLSSLSQIETKGMATSGEAQRFVKLVSKKYANLNRVLLGQIEGEQADLYDRFVVAVREQKGPLIQQEKDRIEAISQEVHTEYERIKGVLTEKFNELMKKQQCTSTSKYFNDYIFGKLEPELRRLEEIQKELQDCAILQSTDEHPDIQPIKGTIETLQTDILNFIQETTKTRGANKKELEAAYCTNIFWTRLFVSGDKKARQDFEEAREQATGCNVLQPIFHQIDAAQRENAPILAFGLETTPKDYAARYRKQAALLHPDKFMRKYDNPQHQAAAAILFRILTHIKNRIDERPGFATVTGPF